MLLVKINQTHANSQTIKTFLISKNVFKIKSIAGIRSCANGKCSI